MRPRASRYRFERRSGARKTKRDALRASSHHRSDFPLRPSRVCARARVFALCASTSRLRSSLRVVHPFESARLSHGSPASRNASRRRRCSLLRCKHYHWFPNVPGTHGYLLSLSLSLSLSFLLTFPPPPPCGTLDFLARCHRRSLSPSFAFCYRTISAEQTFETVILSSLSLPPLSLSLLPSLRSLRQSSPFVADPVDTHGPEDGNSEARLVPSAFSFLSLRKTQRESPIIPRE